MPFADLTHIRLWYEDDGSGPPLLLIAGMASDSASWLPLLPHLEQHYRLIRPDNRSTGRTTPPDAPTSLALNRDDCVALLDHLDIQKAHVLGHSMGGLIALDMANTHADRVKSLTLAASAPMRSARNVALFEALIAIRRSNAPADTWLRAFLPWLFSPAVYATPGAIDAAVAAALAYPHAQSVDGMERQLRALDAYTPPRIAPGMPVQALLADKDQLFALSDAIPALKAAGITTHTVIADAGHSIHWDQPAAVASALRGFAT